MSETEGSESSFNFKTGFSLWLSFCMFICIWFLSHFMKGRRQLQNNLHVIEDGLRRMQDEIEKRQRENSIGYGEDLESLAKEHFRNKNKNLLKSEEETKGENQENKTADYEEKIDEDEVQDKKND